MILPGVIVAGAPPVKAVEFTASTDMLTTTSLTGLSDGSEGTIAFWIKINGLNTSNQVIFRIGSGLQLFRRTNDLGRQFQLAASAPGGGSRISYVSGASLELSEWYHVLASWTLPGTNVCDVYIDDVLDTPGTKTLTTGSIDYTDTNNGLGLGLGGTAFLAADMAEFYFTPTYIDLSVTDNRRKFIKADGTPGFLGKTGQRPTGSSPIIYLQGPASNWGTNSGTGGNFTVTGTFTDATPPP